MRQTIAPIDVHHGGYRAQSVRRIQFSVALDVVVRTPLRFAVSTFRPKFNALAVG